jgi:curved DNA-binding protein
MAEEQPFIDYYDLLQVTPRCDEKILESAYHHFAKMYHPDHSGSADTTKFNEVAEAYRVLRSADSRAKYDLVYAEHHPDGFPGDPGDEKGAVEAGPALEDADDHEKILMFLYKKRRENAQSAGVVGFYLQDMLSCSDEHFEFHKWYLKEKGFVVLTEQGTLAITIQGVDHVISMSRKTKAEKLLLSRSIHPEE